LPVEETLMVAVEVSADAVDTTLLAARVETLAGVDTSAFATLAADDNRILLAAERTAVYSSAVE
jgi:hypothetical protein